MSEPYPKNRLTSVWQVKTNKSYRHFILHGVTETEQFRSHAGGRKTQVPRQDRAQQGRKLLGQIDELRMAAETSKELQREAGLEDGFGLQVEFESFPEVELAFQSLARERRGIELLNVRHEGKLTCATVFVPEGKLSHFEGLIKDYLSEKTDSSGRRLDHQRLIDAICHIRTASLHALWTDDSSEFPADSETPLWWEVWLPVRKEPTKVISSFRRLAHAQNIETAPGALRFPERSVLLIRATTRSVARFYPNVEQHCRTSAAKGNC